jgi:YD repeat-containing protein
MNNCDGLTGEVSVTTSTLTSENVEELIFNQQGLLIRHTNRATGQSDDYSYDFDSNFGFKLTNKTDSHGKLVSYITKWNDDGSLAEIRGSDNSRIVYLDSEEFYKKITHYKGSSVIKTDCYDDKYRLVKTILPNNVTIEYGYNPQGDVISMMKIQGTNVTDQSSFDYDYEENVETGRHWVTKTQFDDTRILQTKVRHFYQTTARLQSDNRIKYEIDWNFDKEPTIVTDKNLLRN